MSLRARDVQQILDRLDQAGWDEAEITIGDATLAVTKRADSALFAAPAPPIAVPEIPGAAPETPVAAPGPPASSADIVVASPSVGVLRLTPDAREEAYVAAGSPVAAGDTLAVVQIARSQAPVTAPVAGTIALVHLDDGANVEYGFPLFTITPG